MNSEQLNFLSNNVKGLQEEVKRTKVLQYLKNCVHSNGFVFLQETHSSITDEKKWNDEFPGQLFFAHGKTNSCGVAIGYLGSKPFNMLNPINDVNGRILILDVKVGDEIFVLANIYKPNNEAEQLLTLSEFCNFLNKIDDIKNKKIILGGDFNAYFDSKLDASGGKPTIKKQTIAKLIEILETFDLCDIWRIRNPNLRRVSFRQNHFSGYIQRRLDYFFISNILQEATKKTDILAAFSTDHSPIYFSLSKQHHLINGRGLWKFNNSLINNEDFIEKMSLHIKNTLKVFDNENISDDQVKWEYLKYEVRKFTIHYSKNLAKSIRDERIKSEEKIKNLEKNGVSDLNNNQEYINCKSNLESIYQTKVDGMRIRSKCDWYENGEKSSKFFLNLEKNRAIQGQIRTIIVNEKEITDEIEINKQISFFYESLFKENLSFSERNLKKYLDNISIPLLSEEKKNSCEGEITEEEILKALKSMKNNKSPGNDGISKEFYQTFWNDLKNVFLPAIKKAYHTKKLSYSQYQAVIKLIEKKGRDKRFIKNWRPIYLLNVDTKLISKVLSERLKNVMPDLVSENQTAFLNHRFISEGGRLIDDLLELTDIYNKKGFLVTIDIEKAFDAVNHIFIIKVLESFGFGYSFIQWIKALLKGQESCIINGGKTSQYFKLERGTRKGDPISAYLFILVLEIVFLSLKQNKNMKGIELFQHEYLYTAYADDTTFFLKDKNSVILLFIVFRNFSLFPV